MKERQLAFVRGHIRHTRTFSFRVILFHCRIRTIMLPARKKCERESGGGGNGPLKFSRITERVLAQTVR